MNKSEFEKKKIHKIIRNKKIKFPIVSKPINEGSSLGVKVYKNKKIFLINLSTI